MHKWYVLTRILPKERYTQHVVVFSGNNQLDSWFIIIRKSLFHATFCDFLRNLWRSASFSFVYIADKPYLYLPINQANILLFYAFSKFYACFYNIYNEKNLHIVSAADIFIIYEDVYFVFLTQDGINTSNQIN